MGTRGCRKIFRRLSSESIVIRHSGDVHSPVMIQTSCQSRLDRHPDHEGMHGLLAENPCFQNLSNHGRFVRNLELFSRFVRKQTELVRKASLTIRSSKLNIGGRTAPSLRLGLSSIGEV